MSSVCEISRRNLIKTASVIGAVSAVPFMSATAKAEAVLDGEVKTPVIGSRRVVPGTANGSAAKVYFCKNINAENLIKMYNLVNGGIYGKVAIKLHTGEKNGPYILPRPLVQALQQTIPDSTIVETNTLYKGDRYTTEQHRETIKTNGWTFCPVDIMDEDGFVNLPVEGGFHLKEVAMGKNIVNYDSMLVLTHFKGHSRGGFGGSMKNIAIGCASGQVGKRQVHDIPGEPPANAKDWPGLDRFMELMSDSAKAVVDHFGKHITFINVLRAMSVDCDCAGTRAVKPVIEDLGILASTDILAIDQASCDLVYSHPDGKDLIERIESRRGLRQLSAMAEHKMGNPRYELIVVD